MAITLKKDVSTALVSMLRDQGQILFASVMMQWRIIYSTKLPTMGVGIENSQLILCVNPAFVESLKFSELIAVLTHEVFHVIMSHI